MLRQEREKETGVGSTSGGGWFSSFSEQAEHVNHTRVQELEEAIQMMSEDVKELKRLQKREKNIYVKERYKSLKSMEVEWKQLR